MSQKSLSLALLTGTAWTMAIRWVSKLLGIISLAVCARILTPDDYGLISMAMVVVGFSNIIVQFGIDAALIRTPNPSDALFNTAWTLRIIQGTIITFIVLAAAPVASSQYFYNDPRVLWIMIAVAFAGLCSSFQNIYVVNFRKNLDFRKDFILSMLPRLAAFVVTVSIVYLEHTYWGLVAGICVTELVILVISYLFVKNRPSFSLTEWRQVIHFSGWYLSRGLAEFMSFEFDRFILGSLGGAGATGVYSLARELSALPATEIVLPIGRALFPTLSKLVGQPEQLRGAIEKSITGSMIIAAPAAMGFAAVSTEVVTLIFGPKWTEAIALVMIFSMTGCLSGFRDIAATVMVVVGEIRSSALLSWFQALLILSLYYPAFQFAQLNGIAWLYVAVGTVMFFLYALRLHTLGLIGGKKFWMGVFRPIGAAIAMYFVISAVLAYCNFETLLFSLICKVFVGVVAYTAILLIAWHLAGRPDSSERTLLNHAFKLMRVRINLT